MRGARWLTMLVCLPGCADPPRPLEPPPTREPTVTAQPGPSTEAEQPPEPWSDAWLLREGARFLADTDYRRAALERSLVNPKNLYSRQRLSSYGLGTRRWDRLPVWNPRAQPVTASLAAQLDRKSVV